MVNLYIRSNQQETWQRAEKWCFNNSTSMSDLLHQLLKSFLREVGEPTTAEIGINEDDKFERVCEQFEARLKTLEAQVREARWRLGIGEPKFGPLPEHESLPVGLCGDKEDHEPHVQITGSLAPFWCTADQSTRLPYAAEQRKRKANTTDCVCTPEWTCALHGKGFPVQDALPATTAAVFDCTPLRTPEDWSERKGLIIADADGWRAKILRFPDSALLGPKSWEDPITEEEFDKRASVSSCIGRRS